MKFPYRRYEVSATPASRAENGTIYRPVIPFTLEGPSGAVDFFGLIDTGADETYLTRSMADRLGLAIDEQTQCIVESASGEMSCHYGTVAIELGEGEESYRWKTVIGITDKEWAEAILGHAGFLEFFDILFRGHDHEIVLTRNQSAFPISSI